MCDSSVHPILLLCTRHFLACVITEQSAVKAVCESLQTKLFFSETIEETIQLLTLNARKPKSELCFVSLQRTH